MTERVLASILVFLIALTASGAPIINRDFQAGGGGGGGGGGPYSFTFVGSAHGSNDSSSATVATTTGSIAVQVGDLILAAVQWEDDSTAEVSTLNDNNNDNALTKDSEVHNTGGEMNLHLWWGIADTANATAAFDATLDTSLPYKKITVMVYRPSGGTVSKDITGTPAAVDDTDGNNAPTSGSFSTTGDNDVVCGIAGIYTSGTWSNMKIGGSGGTVADTTEDNSGQAIWCLDDTGPLSSTTAYSNYSSTRYWVATAIAFKAE